MSNICQKIGIDSFNHFSVNEATDIQRRRQQRQQRQRHLAMVIAHRFAKKEKKPNRKFYHEIMTISCFDLSPLNPQIT